LFDESKDLNFAKHIKELLLEQDCVILPGLGGFVANYKSAEFDPASNTASPPSKQILFNTSLVHNDGLLYAHVSAKTGYGYKEVQEKAEVFIDRIRRDVGKGIKFQIEGLGYFYRDNEKRVLFTEEGNENLLVESFGLPFLQYKEYEKPVINKYSAASTVADPLARQRRIRRWAYGTAAACVLAAIIFIPIRTGYFNQAGINIPGVVSYRSDQTLVVENLPAPEYNIVVGSFQDFANARMLMNTLVQKGYESRILGTEKGFFRVTAGTFSLRDEASRELSAIRSEFDGAWILTI
jgi:nucleoid DNA-binding protein